MAQFLTKLVLEIAEEHKDCGQWIVAAPLVYESDIANMIITVPAGFPTDMASVPRIPIIYELTGNTSAAATVVHDFLYISHILPRKMADDIMKEAQIVTLVPAWRRELMWGAVRVFGRFCW